MKVANFNLESLSKPSKIFNIDGWNRSKSSEVGLHNWLDWLQKMPCIPVSFLNKDSRFHSKIHTVPTLQRKNAWDCGFDDGWVIYFVCGKLSASFLSTIEWMVEGEGGDGAFFVVLDKLETVVVVFATNFQEWHYTLHCKLTLQLHSHHHHHVVMM